MLFTSYEFIAFLAVVLLLYYIVPKRTQWMLLLVASYVFYALADVKYLAFILITTVSAYAVTFFIGKVGFRERAHLNAMEDASKEEKKSYKAKCKKGKFWILIAGLVLNFSILAVLKYTAFAVTNVNSMLDGFNTIKKLEVPDLILPMGISFYTFQTMGYIIDVYRGKVKPFLNPFKLALFTSFFPQLVQGPISRFSDLGEQLVSKHYFDRKTFTFGLQRILWGYFKKLVIADRVIVAVKELSDNTVPHTGFYVVMLILLYSVQIYADFTGGIDITIGISEAMGIKLKENFNRPFSSKSTKEYWNRWHITMGSWFTDYVFYPLSVSRPMLWISKHSRKAFGKNIGKRVPVYLATVITWFLTGLWHGAGWNFIVWGLLNCLIILVSQEFEPLYKKFRNKFPKLTSSKGYGYFMSVRTFLLMGLIRSLDCYRDVSYTFKMWGTMFTDFNLMSFINVGFDVLKISIADGIIIAVGCIVMFAVSKAGEKVSVRERIYEKPVLSWVLVGLMFTVIIVFGAYGVGYDANQFIYNQF